MVAPGSSFRSGFVAVVGRPSVGKSTLLNALLGQLVAPVSPRPQTTRRRQLGILSLPQAQLVFVDTPGIHKPQHKLGEAMNAAALGALGDADVVLAIFDLTRPPTEDDERVAERVRSLAGKKPLVAALNKADAVPSGRLAERVQAFWKLARGADGLAVSALKGQGLPALLETLVDRLPAGPEYFPADTVTDFYERDIAADLIRAAALHLLRDEVPHSLAVRVDEFRERGEQGALIAATLFVERESQKGIVIGKGGSMLRQLGTLARQNIEAMSGRKVYLQLKVKVSPGWRNDEQALRQLGYAPTRG